MRMFSYHNLLKQIPLFQKLNPFQIQKVARRSKVIHVKKGDVICRQGDKADAFYVLVSGRVQAYQINPHGQRTGVEFIRRDMPFGTVSLLSGEPQSHTFAAINDSRILKIEGEHFRRILESIPQLGLELSQNLSRRFHLRSSQDRRTSEGSIISIYSPVSGAGGSTFAVNLALQIQKEIARKVVLVSIVSDTAAQPQDAASPTGFSPFWQGNPVPFRESLYDLAHLKDRIAESGSSELDLLRLSVDLSSGDLEDRISAFVTDLVTDYPFVLVDLPSQMGDVVMQTLTQSDIIQIISGRDQESLQATRGVIDAIEERLKENFQPDKVQVMISGLSGSSVPDFDEVNRILDHDVYMQLPQLEDTDRDGTFTCPVMTMTKPGGASWYARELRKLARRISGVQVGLVLGGGAALGLAHIGVLRVFEEEKIPVDIVAGSSMGALIAALWLTGHSASQIAELAHDFATPKAMVKLFDPVVPKSGLIGGRLIRRWMNRRAGMKDKIFYQTEIPLKIVAYDLIRRREEVYGSGSIVEAVCRSIAIPGVIEPILENDKLIIDGGVLNPLPTKVLKDMKINTIIAVNVLQSPADVEKGREIELEEIRALYRTSFWKSPAAFLRARMKRAAVRLLTPTISDIIIRSLQASEYVLAEQSSELADITIHPDLAGLEWYDLSKVDELIRRGEHAARQALPKIRELLK